MFYCNDFFFKFVVIVKRNANAFLLNATVDVRLSRRLRRRHEIVLFYFKLFYFLNISETTKASSFEIAHIIVRDSTYISTGNDVAGYFRSAANRVHFGPCSGGNFQITVQPILKGFTVLEILVQGFIFSFLTYWTFLPFGLEKGAQVRLPSSTQCNTQMPDFDFLGNHKW